MADQVWILWREEIAILAVSERWNDPQTGEADETEELDDGRVDAGRLEMIATSDSGEDADKADRCRGARWSTYERRFAT